MSEVNVPLKSKFNAIARVQNKKERIVFSLGHLSIESRDHISFLYN